MSQDLVTNPPLITVVPTSDLVIPSWNPRKTMVEEETKILTAFLENGGRVERILVWKGNGQAPWSVIAGQRRLEAFRRLGKDRVEVEIQDISLKEAKRLARSTNKGVGLHWLEEYESWEEDLNDPQFKSQGQIAAEIGVAPIWVSRAVNLLKVLNGNSRLMIQQSLLEPKDAEGEELPKNRPSQQGLLESSEDAGLTPSGQPKRWQLTEDVAFRLTRFLASKVETEAQAMAEMPCRSSFPASSAGPRWSNWWSG